MKIEKSIILFISLILIGVMLACKSSSSATLNENANAKSFDSADNSSFAETNKNAQTLIPTAKDCPPASQVISPMELVDSGMEKYAGCTISVSGKLMEVKPEAVFLKDTVGDLQGEHTIGCGGNFSSETYSAISHKLYDLKSKGYPESRFPSAIFSGKVKQLEGSSTVALTDCVMIDFSK